jgi:RNA polymerase sigma-70 factor, ECF subfamily
MGMDEGSFNSFYQETARGLRAYLRHRLGEEGSADDLMQEAYIRFLRARLPADLDPLHRKNYLYRIATNLTHDSRRSRRYESLEGDLPVTLEGSMQTAQDVRKVLALLKPRERDLLWLAYVEGFSHAEIANVVQAGTASIRPMLARARASFVRLLGTGKKPGTDGK